LPTGESYDDSDTTVRVEPYCEGCRAVVGSRLRHAPEDIGRITPRPVGRTRAGQPPPTPRDIIEGEDEDGPERDCCHECGGFEFELEIMRTNYASCMTETSEDEDGAGYLYFTEPDYAGDDGEWEAQSFPTCMGCGRRYHGDYELGY
jgi:hypothetical protein